MGILCSFGSFCDLVGFFINLDRDVPIGTLVLLDERGEVVGG